MSWSISEILQAKNVFSFFMPQIKLNTVKPSFVFAGQRKFIIENNLKCHFTDSIDKHKVHLNLAKTILNWLQTLCAFCLMLYDEKV